MNLTLVRYFMAAAETGNFTRAAERTHVTQPTLSAGIKRLEDTLGAPLLERGRGAAQLTPAGARFLPHARVLLQEWTAARRAVRPRGVAPQRLRLGLSPDLPPLAALLGGFGAAHPEIALETIEDAPAALVRRLDLGRLDAMLGILGDADAQSSRLLLRQRYVLAVPPHHALAHRASARVPELQDQPFVIRPDAAILPAAERIFAAANVRPRIVGRATSDAAVLTLVEAALGVAILPHWLPGDTVAALALPELRTVHAIGVSWRGEPGDAVRLFAAFAGGHAWDRQRRDVGH